MQLAIYSEIKMESGERLNEMNKLFFSIPRNKRCMKNITDMQEKI